MCGLLCGVLCAAFVLYVAGGIAAICVLWLSRGRTATSNPQPGAGITNVSENAIDPTLLAVVVIMAIQAGVALLAISWFLVRSRFTARVSVGRRERVDGSAKVGVQPVLPYPYASRY